MIQYCSHGTSGREVPAPAARRFRTPGREPIRPAMKTRQRLLGNCRGTSSLEFIAVLPFVLTVMLLGVELSRAVFTYNVLVQAAREGARVGVVTDPFNQAPALTRINTLLASANITGASASVTCSPTPCAPDSQVTASVSLTFNTIFLGWLPIASVMSNWPLTATAVMRYE